MSYFVRAFCAGGAALLLLGACDSGTWVDGTWMVGCEVQKEMAKADASTAAAAKQGMDLEAHAICRKAGKAFTGDVRCENGTGQVKCK
ncbi:MAG: hypothetical protein ABJB12_10490 [Pseudomonadota bacterium]